MYRFLIISFIFLLFGCKNSNKQNLQIVEAWVGRTTSIPATVSAQIKSNNFTYYLDTSNYKIITYVDSSDCAPCSMQFQAWNDVLNELNCSGDININYLMVLHSSNAKNLNVLLNRYNFTHPVTIDKDNTYQSILQIPSDRRFNTLLLDSNNQVLCIGNPANNPKIKKLFKSIISSDFISDENYTPISKSYSIGAISQKDTINTTIELTNKIGQIEGIVTSCDCISTYWENNNSIKINGLNNFPSGYFQIYLEVFYTTIDTPERIKIYGYSI